MADPAFELNQINESGRSLAIGHDLSKLADRLESPMYIRGFYVFCHAQTVESRQLSERWFEAVFYDAVDPARITPSDGFITVRVRDINDLPYVATLREVPDAPPEDAQRL